MKEYPDELVTSAKAYLVGWEREEEPKPSKAELITITIAKKVVGDQAEL